MCTVYVDRVDRQREREKERDGRGPGTVRVWPRIMFRVRVICHFVFWHFVRDSPKYPQFRHP